LNIHSSVELKYQKFPLSAIPVRYIQNMAKPNFILLLLSVSLWSMGQAQNQRVVVDNKKKFVYSDSAGVTHSYISYFGDTFAVPDMLTIKGEKITQEGLIGKTIVYNFWFVSCKPCVAEIPALNQLSKKYQSDSTLFIAITFDNEKRIKEFLDKNEFNFKITSIAQSTIDSIKKISFYPFTAIVTKEGKLSFALFGRPMGKNPEELVGLLSQQLEKVMHQ
jgi:thiol-disulfide isomerase/thioredoxin